jgi:hypothetical protein
MIHQFDHRWATYAENGEAIRDVTEEEKQNPTYEPLPRYWVPQREVEERLRETQWERLWTLGFRAITRATDERSIIATLYPRRGAGNSIPLLMPEQRWNPWYCAALSANLSALCFDFVARQKIGGMNLNLFYVKQFPVLPPHAYSQADLNFIVPRVLELTYTSEAMAHSLKISAMTFLPLPGTRSGGRCCGRSLMPITPHSMA